LPWSIWAIMQKLRTTAGSVDPGRGLLTFFLTINGTGEKMGGTKFSINYPAESGPVAKGP
jgi:hypothetical protein